MANTRAPVIAWPAELADALPLALWSARGVAEATGGVASGDVLMAGVEIDSRSIREGDLFVALKGEAMDGHRFVEAALQRGAGAALVEQAVAGPHIRVSDSFLALQALGQAARARTAATIVGVTGSVGKTSVKEALFAALDRSSRGAAHRSVKSYNNHVGVPLSLARMPARSAYGIFEMGMNHKGEIAALTAQVRPHVAVITNIAPAHIEMLGSEEAIADAKAEIFQGLLPGGTAVIPADSPHFARLQAAALACGAQVVSFGRDAAAHVRLLDAVPSPQGSLVTADMGDRRICYTVAAPGEHWIINSLAIMAAVRAAGGDLGAAGLALAELAGMAGRGARHDIATQDGGTALLIDESYNANPASMRATLAALAATPARRRIAVLGAMKELGDFAPSLHEALAAPLAEAADFAVLVGDEMRALAAVLEKSDELGKSPAPPLGRRVAFAHCRNVEEARAALAAFGIAGGDAILVKGSNSMGLGTLVAALAANRDGS